MWWPVTGVAGRLAELRGTATVMRATVARIQTSSRAELVGQSRMSCAPCDTPDKQCADRNDFFFSRGPGTFRVATNLHAEARAALVSRMGPSPGVVLMRGGLATCRNDSDHEELFRQESYFAYLFGVDEPDWWGMIELPSGRTSLFIPRLDPSYAIWMGEIKTPNAFRQKYRVDAVLYADELKAAVAAALAAAAGDTGTPLVHTLRGTNSDSGQDIGHALPTADGLPTGCAPCEEVLYATLAECRVIKSAAELQVMAYVSWLSSMAHVEVRRTCVLVLVVAAC
jgi:Xaa-Pro dipeptidase